MKKSSSEIQALITLLGDDDAHIRDVARKHLLQIGEEAEEYLEKATAADLDGKVRIEARHILEKIRQDDLISSFYILGLLDDEQFDLEHAAFLLARVGYSDVNEAAYSKELDELSNRIRRRLKRLDPQTDGRKIVRAINRVLFYEEGFRGNTDEYYEPDNSFLNKVLEYRAGIPVSLSVVYLLIARRLDLPVLGINMPVHFICQYRTPHDSFFLDPFNKGRIITRAECIMLVHGSGHAFHDSYLEPASAREILARMIRNLILIYYHRDNLPKAALLDRILKLLRTED